jgi:hypothetical protein
MEQDAKRQLAKRLGEPHVILFLHRDDLPSGEWPLAGDWAGHGRPPAPYPNSGLSSLMTTP